MKMCSTCKTNPSNNQKVGGYCRPCGNAYGKKNYKENKDRYKNGARLRTNQLRELINTAKDKPCADCELSYHPCQMDLDHIDPNTKDHNVSYMLRHKCAIDKIIAEINKCIPVCSNCHRLRSYNKTKRNALTKIF